MGTVPFRFALESRTADYRIIGFTVILKFFLIRSYQQVPDEKILTGQLVINDEPAGMFPVGTRKALEDVDVFVFQIFKKSFLQVIKSLFGSRSIDLAPGYGIMRQFIIDDELVIR